MANPMASEIAGCGGRMRSFGTALVLLALWLLMSGVYKPLTIGFGVASVLLVVFVMRRMDAVDRDKLELRIGAVAMLRYFGWLLVEIAKANWAVTKVILSPQMPIRQHLFPVTYSQHSDLAQVVFANSITLTPGTITTGVEDNMLTVHAIVGDGADDLEGGGMDARVSRFEKGL